MNSLGHATHRQQSKNIASVAPAHAKITHKPYRNKYLDALKIATCIGYMNSLGHATHRQQSKIIASVAPAHAKITHKPYRKNT